MPEVSDSIASHTVPISAMVATVARALEQALQAGRAYGTAPAKATQV